MAIDFGNLDIAAIAHGAASIERVHHGANLIYSRSALVPTGLMMNINPSSINEDSSEPLPDNIQISFSATGATEERIYRRSDGRYLGGLSPVAVSRPTRDETFILRAINASGSASLSRDVEVNRRPVISGLTVRYIPPHLSGQGITAIFRGYWIGKPTPAISADNGIGTLTSRHVNEAQGTFEISHFFGVPGVREVRFTATNRSFNGTATTEISVP